MIIKIRDLINIRDSKIYDININNIHFDDNLFIKDINDIKGNLKFYYDEIGNLYMDYCIKCDIVLPGSKSPNDICYEYVFEDDELVSFDENKDGFFIKDDSSDSDIIKSIVLPNIPIKSEETNNVLRIKGDGWTIISEEEYAKMKK